MIKKHLKSVLSTVLIITIFATSLILSGCSGSLKQKLIAHQWVNNGGGSVIYVFFENGTFSRTKTGFTTGTETGTWELSGNELTLSSFDQPFSFKDIGTDDVPETAFDTYEWFVSDRFLYLYGFKYIAQN